LHAKAPIRVKSGGGVLELRDAIVISGWVWESTNVPERMALALARSGARVLYCENPVSIFRHNARGLTEVERGVFAFGLKFLGHRLNRSKTLSHIQDQLLARQILKNARSLHLRDPYFVYPHGDHCLRLGRIFKRRGFDLIHICMDFETPLPEAHVELSKHTFVIPLSTFQVLKDQFGDKVHLLPQFSTIDAADCVSPDDVRENPEFLKIPRPRLGYLGSLLGRVSLPLLKQVLAARPDWQFVSFEASTQLSLPNEHVLAWRPPRELPAILAGLDVGFMPYDCSIPKNLHCVPLKLFDYFSRGLPVVSTPIAYLRDFQDLVYFGRTAEDLTKAISLALAEPTDSPKRNRRIAVAQRHSIDSISRMLANILGRETQTFL
jgi:hypothetical protein